MTSTSRIAWGLALVILLLVGYVNVLALIERPIDDYPVTGALSDKVFEALWSFDWSSELNLKLVEEQEVDYDGVGVDVKHYTYQLIPQNESCLVHAWVYDAPGDNGYWVILVHGLGGSHEFYEKPLGGYKLAYELAKRGFTVMAIDAAGHGLSCIPGGKSWTDKAFTIEPGEFFLYYVYLSGVRAVEAAKELGAEPGKIIVSGVSMGGMTSLVVGSIHPDVPLAIPIVASGCIPCMIGSGGLANLVGPTDMALDEETIAKLSAADPLAYIKYAGAKGLLEGKAFYILFSGHDEFFPTEGLIATVKALQEGGARVYVAFDGNNNHYKPAAGWIDSILSLMESYAGEGEAGLPSTGEAAYADSGLLLYGAREWRPPVEGLAYASGVPLVPLLFGGEVVGEYSGNPLLTTLPYIPSWVLNAILALLALIIAYTVAVRRLGLARPEALMTLVVAAVIIYALPYWTWPGRFALSLLELIERYGVTPSGALGIQTLPLLTAAILVAPLLLTLYILSGRRALSILTAILYLLVALLPFIVTRLVLATIASRAPQPLPASTIPIEIAVPVILAVSWKIKAEIRTQKGLRK